MDVDNVDDSVIDEPNMEVPQPQQGIAPFFLSGESEVSQGPEAQQHVAEADRPGQLRILGPASGLRLPDRHQVELQARVPSGPNL